MDIESTGSANSNGGSQRADASLNTSQTATPATTTAYAHTESLQTREHLQEAIIQVQAYLLKSRAPRAVVGEYTRVTNAV